MATNINTWLQELSFMAEGEGIFEKIQAGVVALLMGYFLLLFFDAFPTEDIINGPFGDAYWILSLLPYLLVLLGVVLLVSMIAEVAKI